MTLLWSLALVLSAHRISAQMLPPDSLFDRLIGRWVLRGTIAHQQTTHDVTFAWMLGREYVQMHEVSRQRAKDGAPAYEAVVRRPFARVTLTRAQGPVGVFAADTDVGRARGFVAYNAQQQTYLISGSGQNMWDVRDDFHFVWKRISGNFMLSTRARFIGAGVEEHRKIGWTIRPSLGPSSAHVTAALHGNGLMSLQFRRQTGAITEEAKSADSLPDADAIIQLERRDGEYFMSVAQFGDTLVTQRLAGVSLPDTVYVGLFVCSHNATVTERAIFSNVRITTPPKRN